MFLRNLLTLTLIAAPVAAQTAAPKPTLSEGLTQSRTALVLADGKFSGAGADVLTQAIAQSRFVLVGEDHLTREIPQFASAVCDVMHPDAYVVEAGPEAAGFVASLLQRPDRIAVTAARMKAHPNNMAFLDMRDENDLAAHCAAASQKPHFQLWGVGQEFAGSAGTLLEAMASTHPGPISMAAIVTAQAKERAGDQAALATGDPSKLFILAATDADVQALTQAIEKDGTPKTKELLGEFTISHKIYQLNAEGSPDSNRIRAELLKQQFLADYLALQQQAPEPRVLIKFGDFHMYKGFNVLHQRDLGNFVAELADGEKAQSLHILVLGARGTHAAFTGYAKPLAHEPFVMTDDPDYKWLAPAVGDLLPHESGSGGETLTLFDLRKLRFRGIEFLPNGSAWSMATIFLCSFQSLPRGRRWIATGAMACRLPFQLKSAFGRFACLRRRARARKVFDVVCPDCGGMLKIDAATHAVIARTPAPRKRTLKIWRRRPGACASRTSARRASFASRGRRRTRQTCEKRFAEAVRKAKETPGTGKPLREFDLDKRFGLNKAGRAKLVMSIAVRRRCKFLPLRRRIYEPVDPSENKSK